MTPATLRELAAQLAATRAAERVVALYAPAPDTKEDQ